MSVGKEMRKETGLSQNVAWRSGLRRTWDTLEKRWYDKGDPKELRPLEDLLGLTKHYGRVHFEYHNSNRLAWNHKSS